jgi:hypothetical protein
MERKLFKSNAESEDETIEDTIYQGDSKTKNRKMSESSDETIETIKDTIYRGD